MNTYTDLTSTSSTHGVLWTFGWADGWLDAKPYLAQRIFGSLVELAQPIIKNYQGDLYHDAIWLSNLNTAPTEFWFIVREFGTHLYETEESVHAVTRNFSESTVYHCQLTENDGHWTFVAELVPSTTLANTSKGA